METASLESLTSNMYLCSVKSRLPIGVPVGIEAHENLFFGAFFVGQRLRQVLPAEKVHAGGLDIFPEGAVYQFT